MLAATALHFVKETNDLADTMVDRDARNKLIAIANDVKDAANALNAQAFKVLFFFFLLLGLLGISWTI